jgi:hypothetical protein
MNQGARHVLCLSTLCAYVYGANHVSASGEANRKAAVRDALAELEAVGWRVGKVGTDHYEIARPAQPAAAYVQRQKKSAARTVKAPLVEQ